MKRSPLRYLLGLALAGLAGLLYSRAGYGPFGDPAQHSKGCTVTRCAHNASLVLAAAVALLLAAARAGRTPSARPTPPAEVEPPSLLDDVLPSYHFRGTARSRPIQASPAAIFRALREVTLADMPLATALGNLRYLPGRLTGRGPQLHRADLDRPFFDVTGNLVLAEAPDREVVVGCIGRLHNMQDQQFVALADPAAFTRFATPGYEKLAMSLRLEGGDELGGYRLVCEHRTQALSADARWKFALYWWLLIKWGSTAMLWLLFDAIKRRAERGSSPRAAGLPHPGTEATVSTT